MVVMKTSVPVTVSVSAWALGVDSQIVEPVIDGDDASLRALVRRFDRFISRKAVTWFLVCCCLFRVVLPFFPCGLAKAEATSTLWEGISVSSRALLSVGDDLSYHETMVVGRDPFVAGGALQASN